MSGDLARALVAALDDEALDELARLLAPRLTAAAVNGDVLDVPAAAKRTGASERTIRRALAAGALAGEQVAGRWRIEVAALTAWRAAGGPTSCRTSDVPARATQGPRAPSSAVAAIRGEA
jgi:excisionase family DNA binding protein